MIDKFIKHNKAEGAERILLTSTIYVFAYDKKAIEMVEGDQKANTQNFMILSCSTYKQSEKGGFSEEFPGEK